MCANFGFAAPAQIIQTTHSRLIEAAGGSVQPTRIGVLRRVSEAAGGRPPVLAGGGDVRHARVLGRKGVVS
jgi:hypothetical protein